MAYSRLYCILEIKNNMKYFIPLILLLFSCEKKVTEVLPIEEKPVVQSISPSNGLPGDTILVTINFAQVKDVQKVSISGIATGFKEIESTLFEVYIPVELKRKDEFKLFVTFPEGVAVSTSFSFSDVEIYSVDKNVISRGDTLVFSGNYFSNDIISAIKLGRDAESFDTGIDLFNLEIIDIQRDKITAIVPNLNAFYDFSNYIAGFYINYSYQLLPKKIFLSKKVKRSLEENPLSVAPGSLIAFDYYHSSPTDIDNSIIVFENDTLSNSLWYWPSDEYRTGNYELPIDLEIDKDYTFSAYMYSNKLVNIDSIFRVEQATYTFSPDNLSSASLSNVVVFSLSHVYLHGTLTLDFMNTASGEIISGAFFLGEVNDNGDGMTLTVVNMSNLPLGEYYVRIAASNLHYELQPEGNNTFTVK